MLPKSMNTGLLKVLDYLDINEDRFKGGSRYFCPLHRTGKPSLAATPNPIVAGGLYLRCCSSCGFSGSVVDLLARTLDCSHYDALALFRPGKPLYGVLFKTTGDAAADNAFLDMVYTDIESQLEIKAYLEKCRKALPQSAAVSHAMHGHGVRESVLKRTSCGLVLPEPPAALNILGKTEYTKYPHMVMPYTSGGIVTAVTVYNPVTDFRRVCTVNSAAGLPGGIFLESEMSWPDVSSVVVARDEADALLFLTKVDEVTVTRLNPVCLQSADAVTMIPKLESLYLLSHTDNPLKITNAVEIAHRAGVSVRVIQLNQSLNSFSNTRIRRVIREAYDVWDWIGDSLMQISRAEGCENAAARLNSVPLSDDDKTRIIDRIKSSDGDPLLCEAVRRVICLSVARSCGPVTITRTESGYRQVKPEVKQVTNFVLYLESTEEDTSDSLIVNARLKTDRPGDPLYDISVPVDDLCGSASRCVNSLTKELVRSSSDFIPYVSLPDNINIFNTARMFSNKLQYSSSSEWVGTEGAVVRFPRVGFDLSDSSVTTYRPSDVITKEIRQLYGALDSGGGTADIYTRLVESGNPTALAVTGILGHIVNQAITGSEDDWTPTHLILPSTLDNLSMWLPVLSQVMVVLSGAPVVPRVPGDAAAYRAFRRKYNALGTLPLVCRGTGNYAYKLLEDAEHPVIMLCDSDTAVKANSLGNVVFTEEDVPVFSECSPSEFSKQILDSLRDGFTELFRKCIPAWNKGDVPMAAVLDKVLGVKGSWSAVFTPYYTVEAVNSPEAFLTRLYKAGAGDLIAESSYKFRNTDSIGYTHKDAVVVSKRYALQLISSDLAGLDLCHLTEEFRARGMLEDELSYLKMDHWAVRKDVWEAYMNPVKGQLPSVKPAERFKFTKVG